MTKKLMRSLVPVAALTLAVGMFTGCSSGGGDTASTTAASGDSGSTTTEAASSDSTSGTVKDTLIIATANETPSVTTNEHLMRSIPN